MKSVNEKMIDNLLKQSELLLEKSILISEDIKTKAGADTRMLLENEKNRDEIMDKILKESEQIRKNSAQVLSNIIQIQDMNEL
ncbi:hypothetical protein HMPREF1143_0097 [Peptoanaerobacter stomatis]|uniref:Uncharacterized protein n=1 Tax=Peptoanaerobacter stomatis TaxID=796937 RepID=J6H4V3_9FIRM|nr:hypothetical protein [Peptoanaerobacter stomatis]EJU20375.1 hypothetical protein HMPREF1143_0097 [Peptoanaerobacter stomatis]